MICLLGRKLNSPIHDVKGTAYRDAVAVVECESGDGDGEEASGDDSRKPERVVNDCREENSP